MHIINLFLRENADNTLSIGIEQFHVDSEDTTSKYSGPHWFPQSILDLLLKAVGDDKADVVKEQLKREVVLTPTSEKMNDNSSSTVHSSLTYYAVPQAQWLQLPLLNAIEKFIQLHLFESVIVSDGSLKIDGEKDLAPLRSRINAHTAMSSEKTEYIGKLVRKIAQNSGEHVNTYTRLSAFAKEHSLLINDCLSAKNRFLINHWNQLSDDMKKKKMSCPVYYVLEAAKQILQPAEYDQLVEDIKADAKKSSFLPCIGKPAHDGKWYTPNYTENQFIQDMSLTLVGGQLVIDVTNNKSYQKFYAQGQTNYPIFKKEMLAIAKHNGWEFEDTDFHQRMAFTQACSDKIIQSGICGAPPTPPQATGVIGMLSDMFTSFSAGFGAGDDDSDEEVRFVY